MKRLINMVRTSALFSSLPVIPSDHSSSANNRNLLKFTWFYLPTVKYGVDNPRIMNQNDKQLSESFALLDNITIGDKLVLNFDGNFDYLERIVSDST